MSEQKLIVGMYVEPAIWVGNDTVDPNTISIEDSLQIVYRETLPLNIEIAIQRQGFIIVAFPESLLPVKISSIKTANLLPIPIAHIVLTFFNSLLFWIYESTYKYHGGRYYGMKKAINVSDIWRWGRMSYSELSDALAEQPMPVLPQHEMPGINDMAARAMRTLGVLSEQDKLFRFTVPVEVFRNALQFMFLESEYQSNWGLVSLLNKALYTIQLADFEGAHILSWSVAEKLVEVEWKAYIESGNEPVGNSGEKTVNGERRKRLLKSHQYTASSRIEILELAKVISFDLYKRLHKARNVRNNWIHNLVAVSQQDSRECFLVARDLLSRKLQYTIEHPGSFYIQDEFAPVSIQQNTAGPVAPDEDPIEALPEPSEE